MDRHGLVCRAVLEQPDITQRELAGKLDVSLGTANGLIKECLAKGYIGEESSQKGKARWRLMPDGRKLLDQYTRWPRRTDREPERPRCRHYLHQEHRQRSARQTESRHRYL